MEKKASMTALVSAFARAYHAENQQGLVYNDTLAMALLSRETYDQIAMNMSQGIGYFNPGFTGTPEEGLRWVTEHQLAPSPLGRAAFAEEALCEALKSGAEQYLIFAAGLDTSAYRVPFAGVRARAYEIDHPATAADKRARLQNAGIEPPANLAYVSADFTVPGWEDALINAPGFDAQAKSFSSLMGLSYYLAESDLDRLMGSSSRLTPPGSTLVLDVPLKGEKTSFTVRQEALAANAGERMLTKYTREQLDGLAQAHDYQIIQFLTPDEITSRYFEQYNRTYPDNVMSAAPEVAYCLAVRV